MNLIKRGEMQGDHAEWLKSEMVITDPPCGMHTIFRMTKIPRLFSDDNLQLKFQGFITKNFDERNLIAIDDLIADLKTVISGNDDWNDYITKFNIFPDGKIMWKSFRFVYTTREDPNSEAFQKRKKDFEMGEIQRANERNQAYWKEQHIRDEEERLRREFFRKQAIENIKLKEEAEKLEFERLQAEQLEKELLESQSILNSAPALPVGDPIQNGN